jgi:two-component system response regulator NreC
VTPPRACRVLLADDHTLVRAGVRRILESQAGIEVVGEVADGEAALAELDRTPVDVLVLDLSMPGIDGLQVLRRARASHPGLKILVLTMHRNAEYVERAVREGADGYLLKDSAVQDLTGALEAVMADRAYYSPAVQRHLSGLLRRPESGREAPRQGLALLTERERDVLKLVAAGLSTKEIAARLGIGPRTVETHRANVMRKLDLRSVALLTQFAIREGLVETP